ncbi:MAG TPA: ABC transporter permease [Candidatus Dormibacteraeota bacterium]|nr:ABC transporter permease [Candidatus Dormibacteraeota bacterium]
MNAVSAVFADSATMLRRNMRHTLRNPVTLFNGIVMPLFVMLLLVYVLGGAFDIGVKYVDYATPGLIIMTLGYGISATAAAVSSDMTTGAINRLRVMDVSRSAVLNAHVIATTLRNLVAVAFIIGAAFLLGFRPEASFLQWLGVAGMIVLTVVAMGWLTVAFGLAAKTAENAAFAVVPLVLLPFLSSAFVPADKMGPGAKQFAEYQPFTPIIETMRGLLNGTPSATTAITAIAWCVGLTLVGWLWARSTFTKRA